MKKIRVLSLFLAIIITTTMIPFTSVFASTASAFEIANFVDASGAGVRITASENKNGRVTLKQYVNGELTEKVLVIPGNDAVKSTSYKRGVSTTQEISSSDFVAKVESTSTAKTHSKAFMTWSSYSAYTKTGTITYYPDIYSGVTNRLIIYSSYKTPIDTVYQINGYIGTVVTLVGILIGALCPTLGALEGFVVGLCAGLGITLLGGAITSALTCYVCSKKTEWRMKIVNYSNTNNYKVEEGCNSYYIFEKGGHYGKTYYDGTFTPQQWKTSAFAISAYYSLYGYSVKAKSYSTS